MINANNFLISATVTSTHFNTPYRTSLRPFSMSIPPGHHHLVVVVQHIFKFFHAGLSLFLVVTWQITRRMLILRFVYVAFPWLSYNYLLHNLRTLLIWN
jgi:hypothetical protein